MEMACDSLRGFKCGCETRVASEMQIIPSHIVDSYFDAFPEICEAFIAERWEERFVKLSDSMTFPLTVGIVSSSLGTIPVMNAVGFSHSVLCIPTAVTIKLQKYVKHLHKAKPEVNKMSP